ncbi:MAG TPA: hypothetical protein VMF53_14640 [Alphaproteobacteria bacterium]|nr:hypothetical protein [Alphaproteobacteria bacterium]
MVSDTPNLLEERRLALEERKAQQDYELKLLELNLKRAEGGWLARLFTPLTTTIFAGILTLAGSVAATLVQGNSSLQLEREKEQHELILKMISVGDEKQAKANLKFLAESKLLEGDLATRILALKDTPVLPPSNTTARSVDSVSRAFQAIRSDDDAVDLVVFWESGYSFWPGTNPDGSDANNSGITIKELSVYLRRPATAEDLKNLPKSAIRDVYKQYLYKRILAQSASITAPLVRAAYLNFAVWSGTAQATRALQAAAGKIMGKDVVISGVLDSKTIDLINAVSDSGLLVETANCFQIDFLKRMSAYAQFKDAWIERVRAFSPVVLHGVCPELQYHLPIASEDGPDSGVGAPATHGN